MLPDKVRTVYEQFTEINQSLEDPRLDFTIGYKIPWITRWDYMITTKKAKKFNEFSINNVQWLTRRVMIKWWDKFDFFSKSSVFCYKGLINLVKKPEEPSETSKMTQLLQELFHSIPREELKKRVSLALKELSDNEASSGKHREKGECSRTKFDRIRQSNDLDDDDDMLADAIYQDSQDPNEPDEATWP